MKKTMYHLNDRTMKYLSLAQTKRQHQYLGLPGEFKSRMPTEIVSHNMTIGRADELYCTNERLLIDLEEESNPIIEETLMKFTKYLLFEGHRYTHNIFLAVICHKDPKKEFEHFQASPSISITVHYFHFPQGELWEKYENLINKVKQKEKLTDSEALDIAFVAKFISSKYAPEIIESLAMSFENAIIGDKALKIDIGVILGGMILKRITNTQKQDRLLRMINMAYIENEIEKLVYDEYGDILNKKDKEIEKQEKELKNKDKDIKNKDKQIEKQEKELKNKDKDIKNKDKDIKNKDQQITKLNNTNKIYKNKIKQLNELKDLTPEAKKIINTLTLL